MTTLSSVTPVVMSEAVSSCADSESAQEAARTATASAEEMIPSDRMVVS